MHVLISGTSKEVTLNGGIYSWFMLCSSEDTFPLDLPSPTISFVTYSQDSEPNILTLVYSSANQPTFSAKAQYVILGPYPYNEKYLISIIHIFTFIGSED